MNDRLSLGILDNAIDYLLSAAEHARSDAPRDWKYALLHLMAAIELLLKSRLEKEHWSLLFADVDRATQAALKLGDFRSVDLETACNRLEKIGAVAIDADELRHVKELRDLRNRVQHFAIDVELTQIRSLLARGINFFAGFLRLNLTDEMRDARPSSRPFSHTSGTSKSSWTLDSVLCKRILHRPSR